jgi:hypothetical protein
MLYFYTNSHTEDACRGTMEKANTIIEETKRKMVRRAKRLGDLCLLAASPEDAIAHYNSAIETGRTQADWLFVGSACEGLASSILLSTAASKAGAETSGLDMYDRCGSISS